VQAQILSHDLMPLIHQFQALQQAAETREESLVWLKSRLAQLSEVSSELEVQRQRAALAKLSTDLRAVLSSLCQVFQDVPSVKQFIFHREFFQDSLILFFASPAW